MADRKTFGTFDELMAETAEDMRPVARALRQMVLDVHPDAVEVVRLGERASTFGLGPKKMSEGHTYVLPHSKWVNLGFYQGAHLPDPDNRLQGTGKNLRHVKVRSAGEIDDGLRALVAAALAERRAALAG